MHQIFLLQNSQLLHPAALQKLWKHQVKYNNSIENCLTFLPCDIDVKTTSTEQNLGFSAGIGVGIAISVVIVCGTLTIFMCIRWSKKKGARKG